jgi:hypothetical protein
MYADGRHGNHESGGTMNLIEFFRISAYVVILLTLWHVVQAQLARRNPESDVVKAMAFVTGG